MTHGPTTVDPGSASGNGDVDLSIQERLYPQLACFGCGPANPEGLQLRSFQRDDEVTATFMPWKQHDNGFGFLNGGIICTVLDCHSAAAVIAEADRRGWQPSDAGLTYVTAGLQTRYLRPSPLHDAVTLRAAVTSADQSEMVVAVELWFDGKIRAEATALWKRWRPR